MAKAKRYGSGWKGQSTRHSNARKTGRAGGQYASNRINKFVAENPDAKNLTFKKLNKRGLFLKYQGDADKDGVKNVHDCKPLDKTRQHEEQLAMPTTNMPASIATETKPKEIFEEEKPEFSDVPEVEQETFLDRITDKVKKDHEVRQAQREKREEARRETVNKQLHKKVASEEEIDVRSLTDHELKRMSVLSEKGFFEGFLNTDDKYEVELKRRKKEEIKLKTDLDITTDSANEKRAERLYAERLKDQKQLAEAKKRIKGEVETGSGGGFFEGIF